MGNTQSQKQVWASSTRLVWTEEGKRQLRLSILSKMPIKEGRTLKILMFGETACGKSSLGNGIITAMDTNRQYISTFFQVARGRESITRGLRGFMIDNLWLIDMQGIYESSKITDEAIRDIVSGNVPLYAKLTDHLEMKDREKLGIPASERNEVACVVIVIKHGDEMSTETRRLIKFVIKLAGEGVVAYQVVLTHVDTLDTKFRDTRKLQSVFKSAAVQDAVFSIHRQIGVPPANISVVRNYSIEHLPDLHSNVLFLHALNRIVSSAKDQACY